MSNKSIRKWVSYIAILFVFGFIVGYATIKSLPNLRPGKSPKIGDVIPNTNETKALNEKEVIGPATVVEINTNYKKCGHIITNTEEANSDIINKDSEQFKEYMNKTYSKYRIQTFSKEKISIWVERDCYCENHFLIGEKDGYIAVYSINSEGDLMLKEIFLDYPINLLMDMDRKKILSGIVVDSKEELSEILENFIS